MDLPGHKRKKDPPEILLSEMAGIRFQMVPNPNCMIRLTCLQRLSGTCRDERAITVPSRCRFCVSLLWLTWRPFRLTHHQFTLWIPAQPLLSVSGSPKPLNFLRSFLRSRRKLSTMSPGGWRSLQGAWKGGSLTPRFPLMALLLPRFHQSLWLDRHSFFSFLFL